MEKVIQKSKGEKITDEIISIFVRENLSVKEASNVLMQTDKKLMASTKVSKQEINRNK